MISRVFGITGTNGKTSTSYMLRSILAESGERAGLIGTVGHNTGSSVYEAINTTPSAQLLERYFAEMDENGTENCVMEVSSHGIAQGRIDGIKFSYGAFTNLSRDHLDYHKDMEEYFAVKSSFFDRTTIGDVVNVDDEYGRRLWERLRHGQLAAAKPKLLYTASLRDKDADVFGVVKRESLQGSDVEIHIKGECIGEAHLCMAGRCFASNGLTAAALAALAAEAENKPQYIAAIAAGLGALRGVPGRFELVHPKRGGGPTAGAHLGATCAPLGPTAGAHLGAATGAPLGQSTGAPLTSADSPTAIVDYAHTPSALEALLKEVRRLTNGRLITVFGCGGDRDHGKRAMMGEVAGTYSDYCVLTNDNPRSENPLDIINEIEKGIKKTRCCYSIIPDRYQALARGVLLAGRGGVVVAAGKGHEQKPFSDRAALEELL